MKKLADALRHHRDIMLIAHISPDGDALGTTLATRHALTQLGKRAVVVCEDPVPSMYDFMPGADSVVAPDQLPFVPDCALFMDVSSPDRAGRALAFVQQCDCILVLDHHATNEGFGTINVIDGMASSTGELALNLIDELGVSIDKDIATLLYTAISTDTGNFSFSYTTPAALRAVARCLEAGLNIDECSRRLFRLRSVPRTKLLGAGLSAMRCAEDGKIAYICVTEKMMADCGAASDDNEGLVNFPNETEGVQVGFLATERGSETKISLRSSGAINVAQIAFSMGGGGHERAAGLSLHMPIDQAVEKMIAVLRTALEATAS